MLATLSKCAASPAGTGGRTRPFGQEMWQGRGPTLMPGRRSCLSAGCWRLRRRGPRRALARASIKFYLHRKLT